MNQTRFAPTRRGLLAAGAGFAAIVAVRPAWATPEEMQAALRSFTGGAAVQRGRIKLDVPPLVENGNTVPLAVTVDSPMTARDHVKAIAVFNEKNPQPNVAVFHLGPRAGRAAVSTRIRLATTQTVTAVAALSDGSYWSDAIEVVVTLAACVEG